MTFAMYSGTIGRQFDVNLGARSDTGLTTCREKKALILSTVLSTRGDRQTTSASDRSLRSAALSKPIRGDQVGKQRPGTVGYVRCDAALITDYSAPHRSSHRDYSLRHFRRRSRGRIPLFAGGASCPSPHPAGCRCRRDVCRRFRFGHVRRASLQSPYAA